jgi:hypothetical protein
MKSQESRIAPMALSVAVCHCVSRWSLGVGGHGSLTLSQVSKLNFLILTLLFACCILKRLLGNPG